MKWPKEEIILTDEQKRIREDWMTYWHTVLPNRYSCLENFNHKYPLNVPIKKNSTTLEIGSGLGEHINYENIETQKYFALELRPEMANQIIKKNPNVNVIIGDCQKKIEMPDSYFDRVLAIHVLEHLPNLPAALKEVHRVLRKESGKFLVVIPCENAFMYNFARNLTTRRLFEKRYQTNYDWLISAEHINEPVEIITEIKKFFEIENTNYYPFKFPSINMNICIGMILSPKKGFESNDF